MGEQEIELIEVAVAFREVASLRGMTDRAWRITLGWDEAVVIGHGRRCAR